MERGRQTNEQTERHIVTQTDRERQTDSQAVGLRSEKRTKQWRINENE